MAEAYSKITVDGGDLDHDGTQLVVDRPVAEEFTARAPHRGKELSTGAFSCDTFRERVPIAGPHSGDDRPHSTDGLRYEDRADVAASIQLSRSFDPKHVTITP